MNSTSATQLITAGSNDWQILHFSDLHFGRPFLPELGAALCRLAHQLNPQLLVMSGDWTQRAKRSEFQIAQEFINRLPDIPLVTIPGNHDIPLYRMHERLFSPYTYYRQYISKQLDDSWQYGSGVVVALNTSRPYSAITGGALNQKQLAFLKQSFDPTDSVQWRVLVVHHPISKPPVGIGLAPGTPLRSVSRVGTVLAAAQVDLVLAGHFHQSYCHLQPLQSLKSDSYRCLCIQAGTATSCRYRGQIVNSCNLIRIAGAQVEVIPYHYEPKLSAYLPTQPRIFQRQHPGDWQVIEN